MALREYSKDLESRVEQRTREILNGERFVAAGRVASSLGHDLRGPLVTISNAVELAMSDPERVDHYLTMIKRNTNRSVELIEGFRDKLRERPLQLASTDLGDLLHTAIEDTVIPDSVNIVTQIDDNLGSLMIDASQIRRVLDNLMKNSLDAMPDRGELTVAAFHKAEKVRIEVSDTGTGISKEELGSLFTPFQSGKSGGVGLGLVICKQTVEANSGSIDVKSKVGKGTTVAMTLPLERDNP